MKLPDLPHPAFGISQYTTWPQSFDADLKLYREAGVRNLEVCEAKLDARNPDPQLARLRDSGLHVSSVQPRCHSPFPNGLRAKPAPPDERMKLFQDSVRRFGKWCPGTTLVANTGLAPNGDIATAYRIAVREFRKLARMAADHGVRIALEPLNPVFMNTDTFICSLRRAGRMIEDVAHPSFGLFLDVWHFWEEPDAPERIEQYRKFIFGVHLGDWRTPRAFCDRVLPGEGEIPIIGLLRAIRKAGYQGVYTLEIFSDLKLRNSLWKHPRKTVLAGCAAFERIWSKAVR